MRGYKENASKEDRPPPIGHIVFTIHGVGQNMDISSINKSTSELVLLHIITALVQVFTCMYTCTCPGWHSWIHTCRLSFSLDPFFSFSQTCPLTHTDAHTVICTHIHTLTHTAHTCTYMYANTHTHTHTLSFRETCTQVGKKYFGDTWREKRVEFIPVEWRTWLTLDRGMVGKITPHSIKKLRDLMNDSAIDVMYYLSPRFGPEVRREGVNVTFRNTKQIYV